MIFAAILAGGRGTRIGGDIPKQYIELCGVPVIVRTLLAFADSGITDSIAVCVPGEFVEFTRELLGRYPALDSVIIAEGGADRTASLLNACAALSDNRRISDDDVLITHDCARPFVTRELIAESVKAARQFGGATAAIPAVDTICVSSDGLMIDSIPSRDKLYQIQTPQTFMMREFCDLLASFTEEEKSLLTDASAVYRLRGRQVALFAGSASNIKITHPVDLASAEYMLEHCG